MPAVIERKPSIIDIDKPDTWPSSVRSRANKWAHQLRGTTDYVVDLDLDMEDEDEFRLLLSGSLMRAYHATRLLPHEVEGINTHGLKLATKELVKDRIGAAFDLSLIDGSLRDALLAGNVFAERGADNRKDQVCLVLSRRPFDHSPHGFGHLFTEWGGEIITMSGGGAAVRPQLQELGCPAIVVANIDLSAEWRTHPVYPSVHKLFVGRLLQLEDLGADVFYRETITSDRVIDIWQPGHPEYDRHRALPRI